MARSGIRTFAANQNARGFSLIEVAIALMIIGLLLIPFLHQYKLEQINARYKKSSENIGVISTALQKYALKYGRYPLPASKNLAMSDSGYGREVDVSSVTSTCTPTMLLVCRTTSGSLGNAPVLIGDVPFGTLGLPRGYAMDGYARRFTYAVTETLTVTPSPGTPFNDGGGVITVLNYSGGTGNGDGKAHFAIVSHGENGKGAVTTAGVLFSGCSGAGKDIENCDNDAVFNNGTVYNPAEDKWKIFHSSVEGANYYDDYISEISSLSTDLWSPTPDTANLYSRTPGNVRIGAWGDTGFLANETLPEAKLDVAGSSGDPGNVKADQVNTNRLCTFEENSGTTNYIGCIDGTTGTPQGNVFTPEIIGGDPDPSDSHAETTGYGIYCGSRGLKGIKNADEICSNAVPTPPITEDASCSVIGAGGKRIVGGILYCETP